MSGMPRVIAKGADHPQQRFWNQLLVHDAAIVQANRNPFLCIQLVAQPLRLSLTIDLQQQGLASIVQGAAGSTLQVTPGKSLRKR